MTYFNIVKGQETVGLVGNLVECLALAAHLKQVFVINKEIAPSGIFYIAGHHQLAKEKGFPFIAFFYIGTEHIHKIRIAKKDLVGFYEVLVALGIGGEQP